MKNTFRLTIGLSLLAMLLTACGTNAPATAAEEQSITGDEVSAAGGEAQLPEAGEERKELYVSLGGEPDDGFDPTIQWGNHDTLLFQSSLLAYDNDMNLQNDLAAGYTVSDNGLEYKFKLREDARFSDGEQFTAEDVVFTFEKAAQTSLFIDYSNLESVRAEDDFTVVFTLHEAQSIFPHLVLRQGIVPAHLYTEETYSENPVGTGPFKLVRWDRGQQVITERNPYYHGKEPYFEKITFAFLSEDASLAAAKSGTVDVIMSSPVLEIGAIPGMTLHVVQALDARGICLPALPAGAVTREDGKMVGNDVTSDIAIRKAVNLAINRQMMVDGVLNGYGQKAYTECDSAPWGNPEAVFEDNNQEEAAKVLEAAGWIDQDGDGIREKNGLKAEFKILYPAADSTRQALSVVAADMLRSAGINAQPEGHSWDEIFTMMYANPFMFGTGEMSPMVSYKQYSSKFAGISTNNAMYYSNPVTDDYFAKALAATDQELANELWRSAQWDGETGTSGQGEAPSAWLVNLDHLYYADEHLDIGNQRLHGHGTTWQLVRNIEEWKWK